MVIKCKILSYHGRKLSHESGERVRAYNMNLGGKAPGPGVKGAKSSEAKSIFVLQKCKRMQICPFLLPC